MLHLEGYFSKRLDHLMISNGLERGTVASMDSC